MTGSLIQIISKGPQDNFLTGNPQISYFKSIHKKHTFFLHNLLKINLMKILINQVLIIYLMI